MYNSNYLGSSILNCADTSNRACTIWNLMADHAHVFVGDTGPQVESNKLFQWCPMGQSIRETSGVEHTFHNDNTASEFPDSNLFRNTVALFLRSAFKLFVCVYREFFRLFFLRAVSAQWLPVCGIPTVTLCLIGPTAIFSYAHHVPMNIFSEAMACQKHVPCTVHFNG